MNWYVVTAGIVVVLILLAVVASVLRDGCRSFFRDFRAALTDSEWRKFNSYLNQNVHPYRLLQGVRECGNSVWSGLGILPQASVFELGPGHGFLAIKAALNGAIVVALEHPNSHYLPFLRENIRRFADGISRANGNITLIEGDVFDPSIQSRILADHGEQSFDHILVIDVLRPRYGDGFARTVAGIERKWGSGTGPPKFGIFKDEQVKKVAEFLLKLKKPNCGSILVNHTASLERSSEKIRLGIHSPDFPFERVEQIEELLPANITEKQLPTPRNPLPSATLYEFT